jgi:hypothetical protein
MKVAPARFKISFLTVSRVPVKHIVPRQIELSFTEAVIFASYVRL